jgi:hypothetical protein
MAKTWTYQPPPQGIDPDRDLTLADLAAAIGRGQAGRPTRPATVLVWCRRGIVGVVLASWGPEGDRRTSWRKYQVFLGKVAGRREELRQERRKAGDSGGLAARRQG